MERKLKMVPRSGDTPQHARRALFAAEPGATADDGGFAPVPPLPTGPSPVDPARAVLDEIQQKIIRGQPVRRDDWQRFQIQMINFNLDLCRRDDVPVRVKAAASGKCIWAAQQNQEMIRRDEEQARDHAHGHELASHRAEFAADAAKTGGKDRHPDSAAGGDESSAGPPEYRAHIDKRLIRCALPLPIAIPRLDLPASVPPQRPDEFNPLGCPGWALHRDNGLTRTDLDPDDLPDEVYWLGSRPGRFPPRTKEPLFRVLDWNTYGAARYVRTVRGRRFRPVLSAMDSHDSGINLRHSPWHEEAMLAAEAILAALLPLRTD